MYAEDRGHTDIAQLFHDHSGANIYLNAKTNFGRTALMYAKANGHTDVAQLILTYTANKKETKWSKMLKMIKNIKLSK